MIKHGGARRGSGRPLIDKEFKKTGHTIYLDNSIKELIEREGRGKSFSEKCMYLIKIGLKIIERSESID